MRRMRNSEVTHRHKEIASKKKNSKKAAGFNEQATSTLFSFSTRADKETKQKSPFNKITMKDAKFYYFI